MMRTRKSEEGDKRKVLEYMIEDFLEIKASLIREKTKALKEFLFSQALDGVEIAVAEGFLYSGHLVLVGLSSRASIRQLVLLNPQNGRIQVKNLSD